MNSTGTSVDSIEDSLSGATPDACQPAEQQDVEETADKPVEMELSTRIIRSSV